MDEKLNLYTITKKFVIDIWKLEKAVGLPSYAYGDGLDLYSFPKDSKISVGITFIDFDKAIKIRSFALEHLGIEIYDDCMKASFLKEDKINAADDDYFECVLATIAHMATFASMGWDAHTKFSIYTEKMVKENIKERQKCAKIATKTK